MTTILIVEDNAMNMKLARDVLEAKSYRVIEANNGEEGVAMTLKNTPALVLMDIQLPGIDGIEAFRHIRAHENTADIPVVAFTASVTASDRSRVNDAEFDGFVSKPINLKSFIATIEHTLAAASND